MNEKGVRFTQLKAYEKLKKLAKHPIDLSLDGILTPKRLKEFSSQIPNFKLLFGTERIDENILEALSELAAETNAVKKMQAMQDGEVINKIEGFPSEERQVLHTAMRDFFDHPNNKEAAKKAALLEKKELEKLNQFLIRLDDENKFTDLVQIGIGGSDLGPRALYIALQAYKVKGRNVHFASNVDPDDVHSVLKNLDLKKTLVVVVSKSGSTLETLTNEELAKSYFIKAGLNPKDHFIAVTGEKSPLDDPNKYLQSFYMWDFIGGRYSATSMVGGVMLGFGLGFDNFKEILEGAHFMDQVALKNDIKENLPLLSSLIGIWNRNFLDLPTVAVIP
jgi:glucose-6-phosphate isomerase